MQEVTSSSLVWSTIRTIFTGDLALKARISLHFWREGSWFLAARDDVEKVSDLWTLVSLLRIPKGIPDGAIQSLKARPFILRLKLLRTCILQALQSIRYSPRESSTPGWLAQLVRASALQAGGHRFESYITHHEKLKNSFARMGFLFFHFLDIGWESER